MKTKILDKHRKGFNALFLFFFSFIIFFITLFFVRYSVSFVLNEPVNSEAILLVSGIISSAIVLVKANN